MTDRPTPEQIALSTKQIGVDPWRDIEAALREHGYVIVHHDDHPNKGLTCYGGWAAGYDDCWNDIFGEEES